MLFRSPWTLYKAVCLGCYENHVRDHREACMVPRQGLLLFQKPEMAIDVSRIPEIFRLGGSSLGLGRDHQERWRRFDGVEEK